MRIYRSCTCQSIIIILAFFLLFGLILGQRLYLLVLAQDYTRYVIVSSSDCGRNIVEKKHCFLMLVSTFMIIRSKISQ